MAIRSITNRVPGILISISIFCISCNTIEQDFTKKERMEIFEQVWSITNEHFYDPDFNGLDYNRKQELKEFFKIMSK